jgi:hypothetical protein
LDIVGGRKGGEQNYLSKVLQDCFNAWNFMPAYDENPKTAKEEEQNSGGAQTNA